MGEEDGECPQDARFLGDVEVLRETRIELENGIYRHVTDWPGLTGPRVAKSSGYFLRERTLDLATVFVVRLRTALPAPGRLLF